MHGYTIPYADVCCERAVTLAHSPPRKRGVFTGVPLLLSSVLLDAGAPPLPGVGDGLRNCSTMTEPTRAPLLSISDSSLGHPGNH